jgi:hypothetical protein
VRDVDRIPHRLVLERQRRVDAIEAPRNIDTARADRIVHDNRRVADADLVDRDRISRTFTIRLLPLLLDESRDRPRIALASADTGPACSAGSRRPTCPSNHLEHVVVEAEILDRHDLAAVHRDADVLELDAEEQIAAEPLDRQLSVQVLVRFATM